MLKAIIIFGSYPLVENQYHIEYNINVDALYDALTRAMHSFWWEWLDGSWLFFFGFGLLYG